MKADDVHEALLGRFPPDQYLAIREAPMGSGRDGRRLDLLAISLWKSRGLALDGIEVKVSVSDFRREMKDPDKADWWWRHCNRFWIAAPSDVAKKIRSEMPDTWGLLSVSDDLKVRALDKAPKNPNPEPIPWGTCVGLMRASADAGITSLERQRFAGYEAGVEWAKRQPQWNAESTDSWEFRRTKEDLERLKERVEQFESVSGVKISRGFGKEDPRRVGKIVRFVNEANIQGPDTFVERARREAKTLTDLGDTVTAFADSLESAFRGETGDE